MKFESGKTYSVSCKDVAQGTSVSSSESTHQSRRNESVGKRDASNIELANGDVHQLNPRKSSVTDKRPPSSQPSVDTTSERLKAMVANDKSGNVMRRLQAAASSRSQNRTHVESLPLDEPVKPPRRGAKTSRHNRSEDEGDASPYMDVTAAV